jgi:hypothetical protein
MMKKKKVSHPSFIRYEEDGSCEPYHLEVMDIMGTDDLIIHFTPTEMSRCHLDRNLVELVARKSFEVGFQRGLKAGKKAALVPIKEAILTIKKALA